MAEEKKSNELTEIPENKNFPVESAVEKTERQTVESIAGIFDEETGLEKDGDIFWAIQQISWAILKTIGILGILIILIWLIWKSDSGTETPQSSPQKTTSSYKKDTNFWQNWFTSETEPSQKIFVKPLKDGTISKKNILFPPPRIPEEIAYIIEKKRQEHSQEVIPLSIVWLSEAKSIGEISLEIVRGKKPQIRAQKVEEILKISDRLFDESNTLRAQLSRELESLLLSGATANNEVLQIEGKIAEALQRFQPQNIEALVTKKIEAQQRAAEFLSQAKIRKTLLQNIQTFDTLLRTKSIPLLMPATELRAK